MVSEFKFREGSMGFRVWIPTKASGLGYAFRV